MYVNGVLTVGMLSASAVLKDEKYADYARVTSDGQIPDICIGTSIEEDIRYYYTRPTALNDTHGLGIFLMAGAEIMTAKDKLANMDKRR